MFFASHGKHSVLVEVEIIDAKGKLHIDPGNSCVFPKETREQVAAYHKSILADEKFCKEWGILRKEIDENREFI